MALAGDQNIEISISLHRAVYLPPWYIQEGDMTPTHPTQSSSSIKLKNADSNPLLPITMFTQDVRILFSLLKLWGLKPNQ